MAAVYNIGMKETQSRVPLTTSEKVGWVLLIISLLVGFGMTAFAPV
jgi:hypothetical protein